MEPGHEDREYNWLAVHMASQFQASMEPGHEDREYPETIPAALPPIMRLNGARS